MLKISSTSSSKLQSENFVMLVIQQNSPLIQFQFQRYYCNWSWHIFLIDLIQPQKVAAGRAEVEASSSVLSKLLVPEIALTMVDSNKGLQACRIQC